MDPKKKTTTTSQSAGGRQGPAQSGSRQEATAFRVAPDVAMDLVPGKAPSRAHEEGAIAVTTETKKSTGNISKI